MIKLKTRSIFDLESKIKPRVMKTRGRKLVLIEEQLTKMLVVDMVRRVTN